VIARTRLALARIGRASIARLAREERRVAVAKGILDGVRGRPPA
jgi:hypothetical protein